MTDDILTEHHSDVIFKELDEEDQPIRLDWAWNGGSIRMVCGCQVPVKRGDTIWVMPYEDGIGFVPIAIDPVSVN